MLFLFKNAPSPPLCFPHTSRITTLNTNLSAFKIDRGRSVSATLTGVRRPSLDLLPHDHAPH